MEASLLFYIHLISTVIMAGVIWVVQLVHYPSFLFVHEDNFIDFERFHKFRISFIVLPMMIIEFLSGLLLISFYPTLPLRSYFLLNFALLIITMLTTAFLSYPNHKALERGKDLAVIHSLIRSNWIRTFCWSIRLFILTLFLINKPIF